MESEVKIIPEQKLGVINYKGPITDMNILISKLTDWIDSENIEIDGSPFIVYFSPRHAVNNGDAVYDVSISIKEDADEKNNIRVVDMLEHKVLSAKHYGSVENILDTYASLVEIAQQNHYDIIGSPKEVLIKNFHNCDDEKDYITEIQLPIIEMEWKKMSKKDFNLEEEVSEIARKTNFKIRQTEYSYENRLKKLDTEMDNLINNQIKNFDEKKKTTEEYMEIDFDNTLIERYRRKLNKM